MGTIASGSPGTTTLLIDGATRAVRIQASGSRVTQAMLDTGSTVTSVDRRILEDIGAPQIGAATIQTVMGSQTVPVYGAAIFAGDVQLNMGLPGVIGDDLPPPVQCLVGRDVLGRYQLVYDGREGVWALTDTGGVPVVSKPTPWGGYVLAGLLGAGLALGLEFTFALGERLGARAEARRIWG